MTSKVVFKELSFMIVDGVLCTERKRDPLAFHWILSFAFHWILSFIRFLQDTEDK